LVPLGVLTIVAGLLVVLPGISDTPAGADGTPNITVDRAVAAQTLFGDAVQVSLTAANPGGPDGFNLTFTDVLPAGASLSGGDAPDQQLPQADGTTILVWTDVADLQTGTTPSISYSYTYPTNATFNIGTTVSGTGHAYVNTDERQVPAISATGVASNATGNAADTSATQFVPFKVTKALLNFPENELLRGVHDHKAVYRVTITNNQRVPSTGVSLVDFLPADLEFLGCTNVDNSAAGTVEYTGSGRINATALPALTNCLPAGSSLAATTVTVDPDGTGTNPAGGGSLPTGVYTRAAWTNLPSLTAGGSLQLDYAAAVPLRQNVAAAGNATANLDNNTGALTTDEEPIVNYAAATGTTSGASYTVGGYETATAEDVAIQKSESSGTITHGQVTNWTLNVQSSEYAVSTNAITVTDTIPDGLAYQSTTTGPAPTSGPTNNADGTQTVVWTLPAFAAKNGTAQIVYTTTTLSSYRRTGAPVAAEDSWTNSVHLATTATVINSATGTTAAVPVIDDSSASQEAGPVALNKEVAEPQATVPGDCSPGAITTWEDDATGAGHGSYRPGDTVCWRLTVDYPVGLDAVNSRIRDILPPGFTFVSAAATPQNDVTIDSAPTNPTAPLVWTVTNAAAGSRFQVVVASKWTDPTASASGAKQGNLMKLRYTNTAGKVFQLRDRADIQLAKPALSIAKSVSPTTGTAGTPATYTVTVTNSGGTAATATGITDALPGGWTCANITSSTPSGTCASNVITWSGLTVPANGSMTLTVNGTVPADAGAGDVYTNTVNVTTYQNPTNAPGTFTYTPGVNAPTATAQATLTVPGATVNKTATPANVRIGDTVTYTVTAQIGPHTTLYNSPKVTDAVPAGLKIVSATSTIGGTPGPTPSVAGQAVTAPLTTSPATSFANTTGTAIPVVLTITATASEPTGLVAGNTLSNTAHLLWSGSAGAGAVAHDTPSNTTQQTVVEPHLGLTKTDNVAQLATPGATVTYTLQASNNGTSTAYGSQVTDLVPDEVTPLRAGAVPVTATGDVVDTTGSTAGVSGVWNAATGGITFTLPDIAPGTPVTIVYRARVDNPLLSDGTITNNATVTASSLPGTVAGERTTYSASASDTLRAPAIDVNKSAAPSNATIGQRVTYTVTATIPAGSVAYDATLVDALPAHVQFEALQSTTCAEGAATCAITPTVIGTPAPADTTVGFWLGDIGASGTPRTVTLMYSGIVRATASRGETMTNTVTLKFNNTNKIATPPTTIPATFDATGDNGSASVTEVEPRLGIAKAVAGGTTGAGTAASPRRATPGTTLTYTVTSTNSGTSPAYDSVVTDPLPSLTPCTTVSAISGGGTCDAATNTITWSIPSLTNVAPGNTVSFTYQVLVPATLTATDENPAGPELVNTADIPSYYGVPAASRNDPANTGITYAHYTEDPKAQADVELDLASLAGTLWQDWRQTGASVGVLDPTDPRLGGIPLTVTYAGADGVFGTADDEVHPATTAADGTYLVDNLPGGQYRVTVNDPAALAARGLVPAYDADGVATPNVWSGTLGQDEDKTQVDFSYQGNGSVGDTVWFDQDRSGTQNGEPGLAGFSVQLTAAGPDGVLGTADDLTATTTTDVTGHYLFPDLPAGPYSVQVTPPTGSDFVVVSDPQGAVDGKSTLTLAAGANNLAQDFGYAGSSSIGDRVWLDRDSDGVQDPGEPGLVGVTVSVTWAGPDGVPGNGDDVTFTTTTGANGAYLVDGLPQGTYTVTVGNGLPASAQPTYDVDGVGTPSTATVTLGANQHRTDVDFGYDARTSIGDYVWWDANRDGVQDPNEPGLPNVPVTVVYAGADNTFGTADDITYPTTTDATGHYTVDSISEGTYRVTVTPPAGFTAVTDADSPTPGTGDSTSTVTIGAAGNQAQDFGYAGTGTIGDTIWLDQNGDGVQDPGEPGIPGVTVTLTLTVNGAPVTFTAVTDANGHYSFPGLPAGSYTVAVDTSTLPPALSATTGTSRAVTLTAGAPNDDTVDFGFTGSASLGDLVWHDRDADGVADADEKGIPGVTITATWTDGTRSITVSTTTDASGNYLLPGLPAGNWTVVPSGLPAGFAPTFEHDGTLDGTDHETLAPGEANRAADFGFTGSGSIGDTVYLDRNGDGTQGATDPGVPGQLVQLRWGGADGVLGTADDELWTTTTDADGHYLFDHLPDGPYRVTIVDGIAANATNTGDPDGGTASQADLTLTGGASNLTQDFGYQGLNSVGDTVWWDQDGNGAKNGSEPGFADVTVQVVWFGPDGLLGTADDLALTTTTDADGTYGLAGLPDGDYQVKVLSGIPAGFVATVDGGDSTPDGVSRTTLGSANRADLDQDFGYQGSGSLGHTVWLDADGDGVIDAGEPGIPGATVTVVWAGLDGDINTTADNVTYTATTDANGQWTIDKLPAGEYTVTVSGVPGGLTNTGDPDGDGNSTTTLTLPAGGNETADFGYQGDASVGDQFWLDLDKDGTRDAGEPGIPGVAVTVRSAGADGVLGTADDIVTHLTTDADGRYLAGGLPAGPTRVSYDPSTLPAGDRPSTDLDGGSPTSTELQLAAGDDRRDVDFAAIGTASLSGVVFDDTNGDGVRQPGEVGVPGVGIIVVWQGPDGPVTIKTTSGPNGTWSLPDLPPGTYTTSVDPTTLPLGYHLSTGQPGPVTLPVGGHATVLTPITNTGLGLNNPGGNGPGGSNPGGLPDTGYDVVGTVGTGVVLIALGVLLLFVRPRRRLG
jgi:fimbrial isopeptide formation D2 family protein/uncharacterized repeat protein (TIGR01451 family)